jgi:PadR family transcriptional regulator, regulatory protein PadR
MADDVDIPKGTLDLMILKALSTGPTHGYGLARWIRATSDGALDIDDGALYPALHRLEARGWISAEWGVSDNNRKAKFYALRADGRRRLKVEVSDWTRFAEAMWKIVNAVPATPPRSAG